MPAVLGVGREVNLCLDNGSFFFPLLLTCAQSGKEGKGTVENGEVPCPDWNDRVQPGKCWSRWGWWDGRGDDEECIPSRTEQQLVQPGESEKDLVGFVGGACLESRLGEASSCGLHLQSCLADSASTWHRSHNCWLTPESLELDSGLSGEWRVADSKREQRGCQGCF